MMRQRNNTVEKPFFSDLSSGNLVPGTNTGAAIFIPKNKILDISTALSTVFETMDKGKSFLPGWFAGLYALKNKKFIARWWRPAKDPFIRLEQTKAWSLRQSGYF